MFVCAQLKAKREKSEQEARELKQAMAQEAARIEKEYVLLT